MNDFQLEMPFVLAGNQTAAVAELVRGLERGERTQVLLGVTGSGKTVTMANVIAARGRPTLVLSHNKTLAAQVYGELKGFFPKNAVEYFVSYYDYYQPEAYVPATDTYIEKDASINEDIDMLRLRATSSLVERNDVVIVATVSAIYGWHLMGDLWPTYPLGVAIGLFQLYLFGGRDKGLLIPVGILGAVSLFFLINNLPFIDLRLFAGILLVLIGIWVIFNKTKTNDGT